RARREEQACDHDPGLRVVALIDERLCDARRSSERELADLGAFRRLEFLLLFVDRLDRSFQFRSELLVYERGGLILGPPPPLSFLRCGEDVGEVSFERSVHESRLRLVVVNDNLAGPKLARLAEHHADVVASLRAICNRVPSSPAFGVAFSFSARTLAMS